MMPLLPLLALSPALANGLTSHQWITLQAVERLPVGELRDLLESEDGRPALLNGALFPDGGYAVGDGYGEMAHWEPFQMAYLEWIRENDAADAYKAFLFGLTSHGMADQTFDAMFMERSKVYDADAGWAEGRSMDEATDVALAAAVGPGEVPPVWFPEVFPVLFAAQGHDVDEATLTQGTSLAGVAIRSVGVWSQIPETVAGYDAQFPWADAHIVDPEVRCSPVCEADMVAAYWQVVWDRLEGGDGWTHPVIATVPADGEGAQPIEAGSPESTVAIVFARGLASMFVVPGVITVADADGRDVPVDLNLFYGEDSHVILVAPVDGWTAETDYVVTVHPGLATFDGPVMEEEYRFTFDTRARVDDTAEDTGAVPMLAEGCGCSSVRASDASGAAVGVLGAVGLVWRRRRSRGR